MKILVRFVFYALLLCGCNKQIDNHLGKLQQFESTLYKSNCPNSFHNEEAILKWAMEEFGANDSFEKIRLNDKEYFALYGPLGFGFVRVQIYVFVLENGKWFFEKELLTEKMTINTVVNEKDKSIEFYGEDGEIVLSIK